MAKTDRFFIGPYESGMERNRKPWLLTSDAFETIENMYVWRDRARKRFGGRPLNGSVESNVAQLFTRFRVNIGITAASGAFGPSNIPGNIFKRGQAFSIGDNIYYLNGSAGVVPLVGTLGGTGSFNYATSQVTFNALAGNATTDVYFYPSEPVMGLRTRDQATLNDEQLIGFDTQFAYIFNGTGWERLRNTIINNDDLWHSSNSQFFWSTNWRGNLPSERLFWVTNYDATDGAGTAYANYDGIRYYDGVDFIKLNQVYNSMTGDRIVSARCIIPFHNRLVLLNTIEETNSGASTANFYNRARWCQNGNPLQTEAWYSPPTNFGRGDNVDAPTSQSIISAEILKDRLVVYFERSTWELVYTGNQVLPFVWQEINIELGVESTFSIVPFDKAILGVGDVGVHACNGAYVERIDEKIPDEVFEIRNQNNGIDRVYGIRDYNLELVYWTFPFETSDTTTIYPRKVLTYNYANETWSLYDDSITCFGSFQLDNDVTWANSLDYTWDTYDAKWNTGSRQNLARSVIAGNQQGYTFICDPGVKTNYYALQVTHMEVDVNNGNITCTIPDHNLQPGDFIKINFVVSTSGTLATAVNEKNFEIESLGATNDEIVIAVAPESVDANDYIGGGVVARVSRVKLLTKQYNFYLSEARNFSVNKIDFLLDKTGTGEISVDVFPSSSNFTMQTKIVPTAPYSTMPFEQQQDMLWHVAYFNVFGNFLQFQLRWDDEQMLDPNITDVNVTLNAMVIYATPTSFRLQ